MGSDTKKISGAMPETEHMRIKGDSGSVLIGTNSVSNADYRLEVVKSVGGAADSHIVHFKNSATTTDCDVLRLTIGTSNAGGGAGNNFVTFDDAGGKIGEIQVNGSDANAIQFHTTSDARLKNIQRNFEGTEALTMLRNLRAVIYKPKSRASGNADIDGAEDNLGFIADEVETVMGDLAPVSQESGEYKTMDYGKMTPLLFGICKELLAKVESLETRVSTLEAG